jgi:hypothetical protein
MTDKEIGFTFNDLWRSQETAPALDEQQIAWKWFNKGIRANVPTTGASKPCKCVNSCVATIYVCKDCGGRVNKK